MSSAARLWTCWLLVAALVVCCWGHGRLVDPPSRASAWRFGWNTPIDYNDNEGFCGGYTHQHQVQGGKCGLCGDAWDENPRPHEVGGKYATGTIVRQYTQGQVIPVRVDLTSNHRGHFEFRICPNNNPKVEATQTCLNKHPLYQANGKGFKYQVARYNGEHLVHLQLPKDLTCTQCVLQWRYVAGNNWGYCANGTGAVGCGPQEEFRACADVAVRPQPTWTSTGFTDGTSSQTEDSSDETVTSSYSWYSTPSSSHAHTQPHAEATPALATHPRTHQAAHVTPNPAHATPNHAQVNYEYRLKLSLPTVHYPAFLE